jgi:hypothetical protein
MSRSALVELIESASVAGGLIQLSKYAIKPVIIPASLIFFNAAKLCELVAILPT